MINSNYLKNRPYVVATKKLTLDVFLLLFRGERKNIVIFNLASCAPLVFIPSRPSLSYHLSSSFNCLYLFSFFATKIDFMTIFHFTIVIDCASILNLTTYLYLFPWLCTSAKLWFSIAAMKGNLSRSVFNWNRKIIHVLCDKKSANLGFHMSKHIYSIFAVVETNAWCQFVIYLSWA